MSGNQDLVEFKKLLVEGWGALSASAQSNICKYYEMVCAENEVQNLTRLTSPVEFFEGHVVDVRELLQAKLVNFPAVDLGSGVGVPGLLSAIVSPDHWVLVESEKKKAEFLSRAAKELQLANVEVSDLRVEDYLKKKVCNSIVVRAVGPVERIFNWIGKCSTWNNLVLLKGPRWNEEWAAFQKTSAGKNLKIDNIYSYEVGSERKQRSIIKLVRVPRGTFAPKKAN